MLNKEEASALFNQHAWLVDDREVIPVDTAINLTSEAAVNFAKQQGSTAYNGYGIGDYTMMYLTKRGFSLAVSYQNVNEYRTKKKNPKKLQLLRIQDN